MKAKILGCIIATLTVCNIALADRLEGRCLILDSLPEKTISFEQAKEALAMVNRLLRPLGHSVSCRWASARFPTSEIASYHYKQATGNAMDYYRRLWTNRVLNNSSYEFVWVISPELPQLPSTRGASALCYKATAEGDRGLITYLDSTASMYSVKSLVGMHFGHLFGADGDNASNVNGEYSIMSHLGPVGEWFSGRSKTQIRRCQSARVVNNWF